MKQHNRIIIFIIILMAAISAALWISQSRKEVPQETAEPVIGDISIWAFENDAEFIKTALADMQKNNPGLSVTVKKLFWPTGYNKLKKAAANKTLPDIVQLGTTWVPEFIHNNHLVSLEDFIYNSSSIHPSSFIPATSRVTISIKDRQTYSVPFSTETRILVCNRRLLEKTGYTEPPQTWTQVREFSRALRVKIPSVHYTLFIPENNPLMFLTFVWQNNTRVFDWRRSRLSFADTGVAQALTFYKTLFQEGTAIDYDANVKPRTGRDIFTAFRSEEIAMFIAGPWILEALHNPEKLGGMDDAVKLALLPALKNHMSFIGGTNLAISRNRQKKTAWKIIEYLMRPDQQIAMHRFTGSLPSLTAVWNRAYFMRDPHLGIFFKQLYESNTTPGIADWEKVSDKLIPLLQNSSADLQYNSNLLAQLDKTITLNGHNKKQ